MGDLEEEDEHLGVLVPPAGPEGQKSFLLQLILSFLNKPQLCEGLLDPDPVNQNFKNRIRILLCTIQESIQTSLHFFHINQISSDIFMKIDFFSRNN